MYCLSISIALLLSISAAVHGGKTPSGTCDVLKKTNGCSIPLDLPFPYKQEFQPVCNEHDVCYICVSTVYVFKE